MNKLLCFLLVFVVSCGFIRPEERYYKEAVKYKNEGETLKAIDSLRKVISTAPKSDRTKDALFMLGDLYYQIGDARKSIKALSTYIDISSPNDKRRFDVFNKMGLVTYSKTGDYPKALKYYKEATSLARSEADRFEVLLNIGNCYFKMYSFDKAYGFYSRAVKELEKNPNDEEVAKLQEALYYMAFSYSLLTKDFNEGTEVLDGSKEQDLFSDPHKKMINILDKCLYYSDSSKYGLMCKYQKAEVFEELGEKDKALVIYTELKDVYPNKGVIEAKLTKLGQSN